MIAVAERAIVDGKQPAASTMARDWLAHDLVEWIMTQGGITRKGKACEIVAEVMKVIDGISVPKDPRELERCVNSFAERMRENSR